MAILKQENYFLAVAIFLIVVSIAYLEIAKPDVANNQDRSKSDGTSRTYPKAPEIQGTQEWVNSEPLQISQLKGKVVLIDFWTYTCINCIRTLPYLKSWHDKYSDKGLVIIGVHTPEFDFEKKYENVKQAVEKFGLEYPIVQDNDYATWNAYQNRYWPHKYLIDTNGFIRYDHIGEGGYEETEKKIQELLAEIDSSVSNVGITTENKISKLPTTPELYAGYKFARTELGNTEGFQPEQIVDYKISETAPQHRITLEGKWKNNPDDMELVGDSGKIILPFVAKTVNIVAMSDPETEMEIVLNDKLAKAIAVKEPILYVVLDETNQYGSWILELKVKKGFSFNSFTFGA